MPIRIVLADPHRLLLQGLDILLRQEPGFELMACCQTSEDTLLAVREFRPDILILEIRMPDKGGLAVLRELRQLEIPTGVILLAASINDANLLEAMRLGVGGVVLKVMAVSLLIQCVRRVYAGEQWLIGNAISQTMDMILRYKVHAGYHLESKPIQIFLCHASEDRVAVLSIYDQLRDLGYKPWIDKKDLLPGQRWRVEIPKALRASNFVLIFLSRASVAKRGYVQKEFKLALEVLDEMPEEAIYIITVRLDDCSVPDQFSHLHWFNFFEPVGLEMVLRSLQHSTIPE
jgi:DNA-binding NarL/FixJ family response regulator